jgi:signal transduction histidine kinase/HAMP domain-containing protein
MKLRTKLMMVILVAILLQAVVAGVFTLLTFLEQSRRSTLTQLSGAWDRTRTYFEKLKHSSFLLLLNLSQFVSEHWELAADPRAIEGSIRYLSYDIAVDRILVAEAGGRLLADIARSPQTAVPEVGALIAAFAFAHPSSHFYLPQDGPLYLITGTWIYRRGERLGFVALVKTVDQNLLTAVAQEMGTSLALFAGGRHLCSDLPPFELGQEQDGRGSAPTGSVRTAVGPFQYFRRVLSSDVEGSLYLVSLKSSLEERIYSARLSRSFLFAFLLTLALSGLLAVALTTYFISPFSRLRHWIEGYTRGNRLPPWQVKSRDEVGYLARAFHALADKLIREERVVKDQLAEISYLHRYNQSILKNLQAGVLVLDGKTRIEYCNDYVCDLLSTERRLLLGQTFPAFLSRHFSLAGGLAGADIQNLDLRHGGRLDGIVLEGEEEKRLTAKVISLGSSDHQRKTMVVLEDITQSARLWKKMAQAERLTSLGLLSAGMAHEINNPVSAILSHAQYLGAVEGDEKKQDSLRWIQKEAQRISDIVERLRAFARGEEAQPGSCDLNRTVEETLELARRELGAGGIAFQRELEAGLPAVRLSFGLLEQVVLNLLANAVQATGGKGLIGLRTRRLGAQAELSVSDDGPGISKENLKRLFEPFNTSKSGRAGLGLGLAICYSIVTRAGGDIAAHSNGGTTITVLLPLETQP